MSGLLHPFYAYVITCSSPKFIVGTMNVVGINTLGPRQDGRHFADDTSNRIFVNENVRISIEFSLKFVPKGPINNIAALIQIMAWRHPGDKPLAEPVMVSLLTHICVTRPQWVKTRIFPVSTPMDSPHKGSNNADLWCFFVISLNKVLGKHLIDW